MKNLHYLLLFFVGFFILSHAQAATVQCDTDLTNNTTVNYMDSTNVVACLDSGVGALTGETHNDKFLLANPTIAATINDIHKNESGAFDGLLGFTESNGSGTWTLASDFWDNRSSAYIGFKFGTGNTSDEWFVYSLTQGEITGDWNFYNVNGRGDGLSHMNVYSAVPLPAAVWLFGSALLGFAGFSRFKKKS